MAALKEEKISWNGQVLPVVAIGAPNPSEICAQPPEKLILIGTGNPGICHLYKNFALSIHSTTDIPVWIMGLVGFDGEDTVHHDWDKVNLEMQVDMKKHIIKKYLSGVKLICVDHSTSCYIFSQLMQDNEVSEHIIDGLLLMPVLTLPDGALWKFINFVLRTKVFSVIVQIIAFINTKMPLKAREKLVENAYRLMWFAETPDLATHLNSKMILFYFHLAKLLFEKQMDTALLTELSRRFKIICSKSDFSLHSKIREIAEISSNGSIVQTAHSFFVDNSSQFGADVGNWIVRNQQLMSSVSIQDE